MESDPQERPPGEKPYAVFLYCPSPVRLDPAAIGRRVKQRLPESEVRGGEGPTDSISVFHLAHMTTYAGGRRAPAQTALLYGGGAPPREAWAEDLQQTWDWPGAEAAAGACTDQVMVSDMLAAFLDRKVRLRLFQDVLWAVVKETSPAAIRWVSAGKLVDPAAFLHAAESGDPQALCPLAAGLPGPPDAREGHLPHLHVRRGPPSPAPYSPKPLYSGLPQSR
jgi:hypothetical protein